MKGVSMNFFSPAWAVAIRHMRLWRRDPNVLLFSLYWPILDILVWGFLGSWIALSSPQTLPFYTEAALLGILLWQVVGRGANVMLVGLCEELWSHNLINLFSLPLKVTQWMAGIIILYGIMTLIIAAVCMGIMSVLYSLPISWMIATFFIFLPPLFLSGIWLGFTCLQFVITFGRRGVELGHVIGWFFLPFSGAYYPVDVLPSWAQKVSMVLPMSYIFEGMRGYVMYGRSFTGNYALGLVLSLFYAMIAIVGFVYCFNRSKKKGLARLDS